MVIRCIPITTNVFDVVCEISTNRRKRIPTSDICSLYIYIYILQNRQEYISPFPCVTRANATVACCTEVMKRLSIQAELLAVLLSPSGKSYKNEIETSNGRNSAFAKKRITRGKNGYLRQNGARRRNAISSSLLVACDECVCSVTCARTQGTHMHTLTLRRYVA